MCGRRLAQNSWNSPMKSERPRGSGSVRTRKSPQRQLGDSSDPTYKIRGAEFLNPPNGSWGIVQIPFSRTNTPLRILSFTNGEMRFSPQDARSGSETIPQLPLGGFRDADCVVSCRLGLNNPPTSVGGIQELAALIL